MSGSRPKLPEVKSAIPNPVKVPAPPTTARGVVRPQTQAGARVMFSQGTVPPVLGKKEIEISAGSVKEAVEVFLGGKNKAGESNLAVLGNISINHFDNYKILPVLASLIEDKDNRNNTYSVKIGGKIESFKNSDLIKKLISKYGKDPKHQPHGQPALLNQTLNSGKTVFTLACGLGDSDVVKQIWNKVGAEGPAMIAGGPAGVAGGVLENMPLYNAIESGNLDVVKFLLTKPGPMDKGREVREDIDDSCLYHAFKKALVSGVDSPAMKIAEVILDKVVAPTGLVSDNKTEREQFLNYAKSIAEAAVDAAHGAELLVAQRLLDKVDKVAAQAHLTLVTAHNARP